MGTEWVARRKHLTCALKETDYDAKQMNVFCLRMESGVVVNRSSEQDLS